MSKQQAIVWRDLFDPGWREREAERLKPFLDAIPVMEKLTTIGQRKEPCGECHLQPGERCQRTDGARLKPPETQTDAPICPWCDRQGLDTCQHADDARTCGK